MLRCHRFMEIRLVILCNFPLKYLALIRYVGQYMLNMYVYFCVFVYIYNYMIL